MATLAIDLNLIYKLTNVSDVTKLLHETVARERAIDQDLDRQLSKRSDLERNFLLLNTPTAETLELVRADCEQLLQSVQGTAQLADNISSKVRQLDLVQGRVQSVLSKINLILDRTNCINGVQSAMEAEDYEAAARYISSFMELENPDASQAEDQRRVLMEVRSRLEEITDRKFEEAVARRDHTAAVRFARLYKPLGKQAEGLQRFTDYLKVVVGAQARNTYTALVEKLEGPQAAAAAAGGGRGSKADFAAALTALFKDVALCLEEHEGVIKETFGEAALLDVMAGLQVECDNAGSRILQRYSDNRRLERVVREAGQSGNAAAVAAGDLGTDHRAVEALIQEVLEICGLCEEYNQFMLGKMRAAAAAGGVGGGGRDSAGGAFNVSLRELLSRYVALEEYYLDETASMAVRIDEQLSGALTSSMVDDVFFILRKVGLRALAAGQFQATAALLAELNNVLANLFRNALQVRDRRRLKVKVGFVGFVSMRSSAYGTDLAVALNNTDVAADYASRLRSELETHINGVLASPSDREKARSVLSDLAKTGGDFRSMAARGLESLAEGLLPRMRALLDELAAMSYTLTEAEYASLEVEGGWAGRLVLALSGLSSLMRSLLTTSNWEVLFGSLLDKLSARLEGLLGRKPFNQLGGLQLDREVRLLISGLGDLTSRTVRDRLARLSQMAVLLGLETVEELLDYWGGPGGGGGGGGVINWRLSPAEVRAVLVLRTDWSREAIMALPL
ncbi:component of oligomeric golgi complex 4 [Volvox carteri f. nagariensis]|uniref:Conserved oligomeric Golgi complex subunit 4 n=1 Tax=Volvox carteri f. nagariensis TaxID=3068 RepID=D8U9K8_VOLCA|nr:component of oligomeric golgi complex 4 [Volvox carteri f. nagariensis]EFJ43661.1 component of oligomeric golgi complex 4 [Volvox carteri f. nagariensis]|eukprot:XP_002955361.1 component of oligomeric golgi complex 4 [Volvox carteri f. nagariensis]